MLTGALGVTIQLLSVVRYHLRLTTAAARRGGRRIHGTSTPKDHAGGGAVSRRAEGTRRGRGRRSVDRRREEVTGGRRVVDGDVLRLEDRVWSVAAFVALGRHEAQQLKSNLIRSNCFIVRLKVDQRAGQLSLPHLEITKTEKIELKHKKR